MITEHMQVMGKNIDYRAELDAARKAVAGLERDGRADTVDAYWEVCCGDVLLAEENLRNQDREWENSSPAGELLDIARYLEGYDHMLDNLYWAVSRMADAIHDHPRLKLRLLDMELMLIHRLEAGLEHESNLAEPVMKEITLYRRNIGHADNGEFGLIEQTGIMQTDPVEWSAEYERVIDEADAKIYGMLEEHPRGMGFCHAYWSAKARVLREDYGIEWRSPSAMNPGVLFD